MFQAVFGSLEHAWASFLSVISGARRIFGTAAHGVEVVATDVGKVADAAVPVIAAFGGPAALAMDRLVSAAAAIIAVGAHNAGEGAANGFTVQVTGQAAQDAIALANLIKAGAAPAGYPVTHNEVAAMTVSTAPQTLIEPPAAPQPAT